MASDIWLRTILIMRKETRYHHMGYSYQLTARVLLYASFHRQDNTYHGLCYTSRGALAGTRNSSMGPPHEGSIRRPTAPWANALPLSYIPLLPGNDKQQCHPTWFEPTARRHTGLLTVHHCQSLVGHKSFKSLGLLWNLSTSLMVFKKKPGEFSFNSAKYIINILFFFFFFFYKIRFL